MHERPMEGLTQDYCVTSLQRHGVPVSGDIPENELCIMYERVQRAVQRLPQAQQQTLILFAEEGFTYAEIALIMNTRLSTVRSRLYHAKQSLRQKLGLPTDDPRYPKTDWMGIA